MNKFFQQLQDKGVLPNKEEQSKGLVSDVSIYVAHITESTGKCVFKSFEEATKAYLLHKNREEIRRQVGYYDSKMRARILTYRDNHLIEFFRKLRALQ